MNRGLFGFLVFLGVVVLGLAVAAFALGPNRLAFVFHAERRTEPVVIVELLSFDDAEHAQAYQSDFVQPASGMIRVLGGEQLWRANVGEVVAGETSGAWSMLGLVRYPSRAAFIELVTSGDYRALRRAHTSAVRRSAIFAATPLQDFSEAGRAHAVRLLAAAREDSLDTYAAKWLTQDEQMLQQHGGALRWRARLSPLVGDANESFDEIQIVGFDDAEQRRVWAADPQRLTLQTLQRRLFRRDVLVFVDASAADLRPAASSVEGPATPSANDPIAPAEILSAEEAAADADAATLDKAN